jgi:hypothetical protein
MLGARGITHFEWYPHHANVLIREYSIMKELAVKRVESVVQMALALLAVVVIGMVVSSDADARELDRLHAAALIEGRAWSGSAKSMDDLSPAGVSS